MAERKLNFNAPFLSTRRIQYKTAVSVRRNKSLNFTDDNSKTYDSSPSSVPVLVSQMGFDHVTEATSVPFTWEQAPGRIKSNDFSPQVSFSAQEEEEEEEVLTPCLPPGKVMEKAIDGNLTRLQSLKGKEIEESEDEDDVFSDARETLSAKDSFSINHSISGVSGYGVVESKKPTNLSEDTQSRDFMLNRFLPAAKAMTVEQPHYVSNRKPSSFMCEPTIKIRDLVPEEKRQTPKSYDETLASPYHYHQDIDDEESDEESDDENVSEYAYLSKRGCGMLPQLCFKHSLGMVNTVTGIKAKPSSPITSPSHEQVRSSKVAQLKSRFLSAKKLALDSVSKNKSVHLSLGKKIKSESNLTSDASMSLSPYGHARCMSPFRSTGNNSPFHPTGLRETRKETENMRANRLNKHTRNISRSQELLHLRSNGSTSSLSEKTVHVDTENCPNVTVFSEEADMVRTKPDSNPDLEALESISIRSCEMVKGHELVKINSGLDRPRLAPPSPKKPSESWLLHNLPSVTTQIPSRRYSFNTQKEDNIRNVTKWETIVKTSYMHRDHIRYSEELVTHTSLQS